MKWRGEKPLNSFDNICPHRYTKGKMVGQRCTQRIHEGETKCSKHKIRNKPFLNEDVKLVSEMNELTITELEHSEEEEGF
jgi:hypothetical protein